MTTKILETSELCGQVIAEVEKAIVGKRSLLETIMASVLAGGHVLLEDYPGLGKTLIATSFAQVLGLDFKRLQFTPDLLPGDITGGYIYDRTKNRFALRQGPIFANIILADEINRASPKTQSALLEAMQEGQVTLEGETLRLPQPFLDIARGCLDPDPDRRWSLADVAAKLEPAPPRPKWAAVRRPSSARMRARSMAFLSSRTLPGQS